MRNLARSLAPRARRFAGLGVFIVGASCAGEPPTGTPAPPQPPIGITVCNVYSGVLAPGETREFVVSALAGNLHRIHFQAQSGNASDTLVLAIRLDSLGPVAGTLVSTGVQATLAEREFLVEPAAADARYSLSVRGASSNDGGAFRVVMLPPGSGPERANDTLVVGDSVITEALDAENDVDRFVLVADSGSEYVIALGLAATRAARQVTVSIDDGLGSLFSQIFWRTLPWTATAPEQRAVRVRFNKRQPWLIIVSGFGASGTYGSSPVVPGGYTLWVRRVDPLPENRPSLIAVGDTITEAIDPIGDEDNYRFVAQEGELLRIDAAISRTLASPIEIRLDGPQVDFTSEDLVAPPPRLDATGWNFRVTATGEFNIRLRGGLDAIRDSLTSPYRLELRRIDRTPETAGDTVTPTDTVTVESIERSGDIDEFRLLLAPSQIAAVRVIALPDQEGAFQVSVGDTTGGFEGTQSLSAANPTYYGQIVGGPGREVRILVSGIGAAIGGYRIELEPIDRAPETVPATLPLRVWVSGETLVPAADFDEFEFPMIAGKRYNVLFALDSNAVGEPLLILDAPSYIAFTSPHLGGSLGSFSAPSTGMARFHVIGALVGSYRVMAYDIDSLPEVASVGRVIGDTIVGESIDLPGDIDEFTFSGVAGDRVRFSISDGNSDITPTLGIAVYHPLTDALLLGLSNFLPPEVLELPVTGLYRLRVRAGSETSLRAPLSYRATLVRAP